jgi:hypothetical protein
MQYIRAIRSILVVSNLGCCGVNPALRARHTQAIRAFCGVASKKLVNSGSINAVNIRSTEMMKKFPRDRVITGRSDRAPPVADAGDVLPADILVLRLKLAAKVAASFGNHLNTSLQR